MRLLQIALAVVIGCSSVSAQEMPPAKVVVTKIVHQEISANQSFLGVLYYDRASNLSSEVAGLVENVSVRIGDKVKKGTPLVSLNTDILDKNITLGKTRLEQISLRIQHSEKNYKRLERLLSQDGVSEKDYDDALYTYENFIKEKQLAEEELAKLLIQKRKSAILAPFAGIILEKNVDTGDWVQQGNKLLRIGSVQDLFVRVPIAETDLQYVIEGTEVPVVINAFQKEITGVIDDVEPRADAQTKNVFIKVRIPSMENVAENMSASVFMATSKKKQLAIIPRDALIKFQGQDFVYTVKEGKASILPVNIVTYLGQTIGADNPYFAPGMPVVVEGNERLQPDQPVSIEGEK